MNHEVSADLLEDLRKCIGELIECHAFELQLHTDEDSQLNCYIPYMMNDALECYFILKDCKMTGESVSGTIISADASGDSDEFGDFASDKKLSVELIDDGLSKALMIRQITGEVSMLWFQDVTKELKCYRYHEIGHFWVKGQEHYRQLVYMIGTIYDKFSYMGESLCNAEELALLPLMEFAPFRYWSPIHESLDEYYPDTLDGFTCFEKLCMEASDFQLLKLVQRYKKVVCWTSWLTNFYRKIALPRMKKRIASELVSSDHEALFELIYRKVCEASSKYPPRDYGEIMNAKIIASRNEVIESLTKKGFVGEYPRFSKENISVMVAEEHPFTLSVLEYENYGFRMQFMVSDTGKCPRRWIAKSVEEL